MAEPREMEFQICKCERVLPLTEEYWHRDNKHPSGFQRICKECTRFYNSKEQRLARDKRRESLEAIKALNTLEPEHFGPFEARALRQRLHNIDGAEISIYQECRNEPMA